MDSLPQDKAIIATSKVGEGKGGSETTRPFFNPDSRNLRKADIRDFINTNYPHATISSKANLSQLRQIARELIGSDPSSSELSSSPASVVESPEPVVLRKNPQDRPHPSTPSKSHKRSETYLSTSRGRPAEKPYTRPTTPAKPSRKAETSSSPMLYQPPAKTSQCPPTPSRSSIKPDPSALHKKSIPKNSKKKISVAHAPATDNIKNKKLAAHSRLSSSSQSTRALTKPTSKYNRHKKHSSRAAISKKVALERSPSLSASDLEESDHSSRISLASDPTQDSSTSDSSQQSSSGSDSTEFSSRSNDTDISIARVASGSKKSCFKKSSKPTRFPKAEDQKSKKKKNHASQSRRVSFVSKSLPTVKSVKKPHKSSQLRWTCDPLDDLEKASDSLDFPRVRLDRFGSSANMDVEVPNGSNRSNSRKSKNRYPNLDQGGNSHSVNMNESFFTPASLSYYSDNPYQPHNSNSYLYPHSTQTFSNSDEKHRTDRYNYSPVAFYSPMDSVPSKQSSGGRAPSSSTSPWNFYDRRPDSTSDMHHTYQPPPQGTQPANNLHPSGTARFSANPHPQTATSNYNQYQQEHLSPAPSSFPLPPAVAQTRRESTTLRGTPSWYQDASMQNPHVALVRAPSSNPITQNSPASFSHPHHEASATPSSPAPSYLGSASRDLYHQAGQRTSFSSPATFAENLPPPPKASTFRSGNFGQTSMTSSDNLHHQPIQPSSTAYHQAGQSSSLLSPVTPAENPPPPPKTVSLQTGLIGQTSTTNSYHFPPRQSMNSTPDSTTPTFPSFCPSQNTSMGCTSTQRAPTFQKSDCTSSDHQPKSSTTPYNTQSSSFKFVLPLQNGNSSQVIPSISLTSASPPTLPSQNSSTSPETVNKCQPSNCLEVPTLKNQNRSIKEIPKARTFSSSNTSTHESGPANKGHPHSSNPIAGTDSESLKLGGFSQKAFDIAVRGALMEFLSKQGLNLNKECDRGGNGGALADMFVVHGSNLNSERQTTTEQVKNQCISSTASNQTQEIKKINTEASSQIVQDPAILHPSSSQTPHDSQAVSPSNEQPNQTPSLRFPTQLPSDSRNESLPASSTKSPPILPNQSLPASNQSPPSSSKNSPPAPCLTSTSESNEESIV